MKFAITLIRLAIVLICMNLSAQRVQAGELLHGVPPDNWVGYEVTTITDWEFWSLAAWYQEPLDKIIADMVHPGGSEFDERRFVKESSQRIKDGVDKLMASQYNAAYVTVSGVNVYHREFDFDNNTMDFKFQSCIEVGEIGRASKFAPSIHIYIPLNVTGDKPFACEATVTVQVKDADEGERLFNQVESEGASASLKCMIGAVDDYMRPMNLVCWVFDLEIKAGGGSVIFSAKGSGSDDSTKWTFENGTAESKPVKAAAPKTESAAPSKSASLTNPASSRKGEPLTSVGYLGGWRLTNYKPPGSVWRSPDQPNESLEITQSGSYSIKTPNGVTEGKWSIDSSGEVLVLESGSARNTAITFNGWLELTDSAGGKYRYER